MWENRQVPLPVYHTPFSAESDPPAVEPPLTRKADPNAAPERSVPNTDAATAPRGFPSHEPGPDPLGRPPPSPRGHPPRGGKPGSEAFPHSSPSPGNCEPV